MQRTIQTASLFILLAVVVLRPLVAESYDSAQNSLTQALTSVADPTPVRTLVFDLLILIGTTGWLIARAVGQTRPYRRTGLEWGFVLVALAAGVSCFAAGNKRLAINGSIDWLCLPILTIALTQLLARPWHRRLLLAAVLASACAQATQCLEQATVGYDETWQHYQSIKDSFWSQQGIPLDAPQVENFERRIQSGEATGGLYHSNVTGSLLVLCAMAAIGLTLATWRRASETGNGTSLVATVAVTLLIGFAAVTTNSLGAAISAAAGLLLWLTLHVARSWIDTHPGKAVAIAWCFIAAGGLAVIGHGRYHDSLPGWSLTFRWQWWKASADLVADHRLTGVGRENFRRHYLAYKSIQSPEEVANPHNLFVQAAADWGVIGLAGILTMMVGASLVIARSAQSDETVKQERAPPPTDGHLLPWTVAFGLTVALGRLPLLGTNDSNFLYYATVTTTIAWLLGFVCASRGMTPSASPRDPNRRLVATGVGVGLFTFLLHDMINFAFFVPGAATTFFALLAFVMAERYADESSTTQPRGFVRWLPLGGCSTAVLLIIAVGLVPVARSHSALQRARTIAGQPLPTSLTAQLPYHHFQRAADLDPLDPTPLANLTTWLIRASYFPGLQDQALGLADESLRRAIERDPVSLKLRRTRVQLYRRMAEANPTRERFLAAIDAAQDAQSLYPQDPEGFVALAGCQLDAGAILRDTALLEQARNSYHRAIELDGSRLWWEELHRFSESERQAIDAAIERASSTLNDLSN